MHVRLLMLAIAATFPAPLLAAPESKASAATDANEKVCENVTQIGSRLAKRRVCATRAEWEERNRQDREAVSQAQKQIGGPCSTVSNKTGGVTC